MEIVWSKLAYEHFLEILIYVENNFGMLTAQKTRQKIQDKVNLLAKHPYIGIIDSDFSTLFNNITVRHLKLSPNVIYYLIDENRIVIAAMLHSKQSPETVRKTISEFMMRDNSINLKPRGRIKIYNHPGLRGLTQIKVSDYQNS